MLKQILSILMKPIFLWLLLFISCATAQSISIVKSFPAPTPYMADITWRDSTLVVLGLRNHTLYLLNPATGAIRDSIPTAVNGALGLTIKDGYFWLANFRGRSLVKIDNHGNKLKTVKLPFRNPMGIEWDGTSFRIASSEPPNKIVAVDSTGTLMNYFFFPYPTPFGLTANDSLIWCVNNIYCCGATIYAFESATGNLLYEFPAPEGGKVINGLAWDGNYLWIADQSQKRIYQVKITP